jgi:hypothetical protein
MPTGRKQISVGTSLAATTASRGNTDSSQRFTW